MAGFPRLPLHVGDYIKDTPPICRNNWEHHGIYLIALMLAWSTPGCRLPNDPKWLAERFGCTQTEYETFVRPVLARYFKGDGNWLRQKRLSLEKTYVEKQSVRAKSRWKKEKEQCRNPIAADAITAYAPTPTPTQESLVTDSLMVGRESESTRGSSRPVLGNFDFCSDDGSVVITAEEFTALESELPAVKNIRGLVRHACRSWLLEVDPPDRRKDVLLRWLRKKAGQAPANSNRRPANDNRRSDEERERRFRADGERHEQAKRVRELHARIAERRRTDGVGHE